MAEPKFTDEEIVKSLECCANADCVNCPRWSEEWYSGMCADFLPSVLDLFKRQKAEVAREIFEEIENYLESKCLVMKDERGIDGYVKSSICYAVAELKKKYTEGKYENQN